MGETTMRSRRRIESTKGKRGGKRGAPEHGERGISCCSGKRKQRNACVCAFGWAPQRYLKFQLFFNFKKELETLGCRNFGFGTKCHFQCIFCSEVEKSANFQKKCIEGRFSHFPTENALSWQDLLLIRYLYYLLGKD